MTHFLEILSIPFAVITVAFALERAINAKRRIDRVFYGMASIACLLLTLAQSSWYAQVMNGMNMDTEANNLTWAIFNLLVTASYAYSAWTNKHR